MRANWSFGITLGRTGRTYVEASAPGSGISFRLIIQHWSKRLYFLREHERRATGEKLKFRIGLAATLAFAAIISVWSPVQAQTDETTAPEAPAAKDGSSTIVYPASYFEQYAPVSANDMLRRIPGISLALQGGGGPRNHGNSRGLGSGSNQILINGKRVAGKSNQGKDAIDRISASQVERIEIIRGTSAELDVRSAGPIINVVLREGISQNTLSWKAEVRLHEDNTVRGGGSVSYSGKMGDLQYLGSIEVEPRYENRVRHELSVNPDLSPNDRIAESAVRKQMNYTLNGNVIYAITPNDEARLNVLARRSNPPTQKFRQTFDETDTLSSDVIEDIDAVRHKWEVGGDYEHTFDDRAKFKVLFIVNDDTDDYFREQFRIFDVNDGPGQDVHLDLDRRTRERIIRTSYKWGFAGSQDIELGVEGAQTIFNSMLEFGATPAVTSLNIDRVDEIRAEPFVVHNWALAQNMTLESGVTLEFSKLSQTGEASSLLNDGVVVDPEETMFLDQSRSFFFIRPKIDWRYDISKSFQIRATVERVIKQLSFSNFVVSAEGNDDDQDTEAGNPELVQEKAWDYELNLEYRLPNDGGVLNSRIFYSDIQDVIDRVPTPGDDILSAPGNIGDGKKYGIDLDASVRLGFMGVPDLVLTAGAQFQRTSVMDPFLEEKRSLTFEGDFMARLQLRHDIPKWNMNYGFSYFYSSKRQQVDIDDIADYKSDPSTSAFIEKVAFGGLTFRLAARNLFDGERRRVRTRFDGSIVDGIIEEIEDSASGTGPTYVFSVRGTF